MKQKLYFQNDYKPIQLPFTNDETKFSWEKKEVKIENTKIWWCSEYESISKQFLSEKQDKWMAFPSSSKLDNSLMSFSL